MPRLAVVGHVEWVDFVQIARMPREGEVVHADGAFSRAAGGGGVASVVLAEMGAKVEFFVALGDDALGHAAADELRGRGVTVHAAWRSDEPTRRAVTLLEDRGERTIVTVGDRLEPRGSDELDWDVLEGCGGVYFTAGDLGALEQARRARVLVATPRGRDTLEQGPTIDALVFSELDQDEVEWARQLRGNARLLVETRGADGGAWRGASDGRWEAVTPDAPVKDSYGAGDSFAAGFTFGLGSGASVAEAAEIGARAGARMLTRAGAP
jgi:ribokinase